MANQHLYILLAKSNLKVNQQNSRVLKRKLSLLLPKPGLKINQQNPRILHLPHPTNPFREYDL